MSNNKTRETGDLYSLESLKTHSGKAGTITSYAMENIQDSRWG